MASASTAALLLWLLDRRLKSLRNQTCSVQNPDIKESNSKLQPSKSFPAIQLQSSPSPSFGANKLVGCLSD
eukprot:16428155-Heterocapsa_arctica.AAC.1